MKGNEGPQILREEDRSSSQASPKEQPGTVVFSDIVSAGWPPSHLAALAFWAGKLRLRGQEETRPEVSG